MASTEVDAPREEQELSHHPGPRQYVAVAVVLSLITAVEVAIYYVPALESLLVPMLIFFSVMKFVLVLMWFMHLRFDSNLFKRLFVTGIILAFFVFGVVLTIFFLHGQAGPGQLGT
ncbi:MAG TPA: cytochrome C oxidase subunit IV family protein [Actinomycetota bacterium]